MGLVNSFERLSVNTIMLVSVVFDSKSKIDLELLFKFSLKALDLCIQ